MLCLFYSLAYSAYVSQFISYNYSALLGSKEVKNLNELFQKPHELPAILLAPHLSTLLTSKKCLNSIEVHFTYDKYYALIGVDMVASGDRACTPAENSSLLRSLLLNQLALRQNSLYGKLIKGDGSLDFEVINSLAVSNAIRLKVWKEYLVAFKKPTIAEHVRLLKTLSYPSNGLAQLLDRYYDQRELLKDFRQIGAGGIGTVYEGHSATLGMKVAVKSIRLDALDPRIVVNEIEAMRYLSGYRYFPRFHWAQMQGLDRVQIIMEHLVGVDAEEAFLKQWNPTIFPPDILAAMAKHLLGALQLLKYRSMAHRDVKPSNVFLTADGRLLLIDLGLVSFTEAHDGGNPGTLGFVAPEMFFGNTPPSDRSDIWALGITLLEMVLGDPLDSVGEDEDYVNSYIEVVESSLKQAQPLLDANAFDFIRSCLLVEGRPDIDTLLEHPFIAMATSDLSSWIQDLVQKRRQ